MTVLNGSKQQEARCLAAALWNLGSGSKIQAEQITKIVATREHPLKQGEHSRVDLFVALDLGGDSRQLAVEVKVDGPPSNRQLASMAEALGNDRRSELVLLTLGAAQASRIEPDGNAPTAIKRWTVADMLGLGELVTAASPVPTEAQAWLAELEREELRRKRAWTDEAALQGCGFRERLMLAYRYGEAAKVLQVSNACWEVSLQRHGVVLHGKSSHREVPGTNVTLYLEVADRTLRVKAGAWYDDSDARAAAEPLRPLITHALVARGFSVKASKKSPGSSVTLLSIDPEATDWPPEAFIDRLQRVHAAWEEAPWPS
ncbi:hypothetical protein [Nannocystis sp. SCPEA4]|uniref:hypothetical protein n=1 Tax=Nannocystis sp. SCPEA4 TaxID=2996787 RepID=UPI00226E32A6|nr:hypothetical protein [Nannocystis sp. SCPEA4]MCY1060706.1 hypothetical protein [Nannocystis sp. SCPEA4]